MRTDVACDKLCDIAPLISDIAEKAKQDDELRKNLLNGVSSKKITDEIKFLSALVKKCKYEVLSILGVWYDKSTEEIAEQDFFTETIPMIKKLIEDADLKSFFTLSTSKETAAQTVEEKVVEESSPISENIAAETETLNAKLVQYSDI